MILWCIKCARGRETKREQPEHRGNTLTCRKGVGSTASDCFEKSARALVPTQTQRQSTHLLSYTPERTTRQTYRKENKTRPSTRSLFFFVSRTRHGILQAAAHLAPALLVRCLLSLFVFLVCDLHDVSQAPLSPTHTHTHTHVCFCFLKSLSSSAGASLCGSGRSLLYHRSRGRPPLPHRVCACLGCCRC